LGGVLGNLKPIYYAKCQFCLKAWVKSSKQTVEFKPDNVTIKIKCYGY
jgi:hypothetical protein